MEAYNEVRIVTKVQLKKRLIIWSDSETQEFLKKFIPHRIITTTCSSNLPFKINNRFIYKKIHVKKNIEI